ncbi:hypothetical protein P4N68_00245 [Corynebacterium felinum]|uniref:hypothetical protein n=1 Tax=Corynebacterium felinum TaxID=131318 RepID=UPI0023F6933D|nr:hypothetical protein [Corynebacterium felinum]MDF5819513.1 hypothetical protein [Corynebacterium felinum]
MTLFMDKQQIIDSVHALEQLSKESKSAAWYSTKSPLNGSFSSVSGLDQLGEQHGRVLHGGAGSAHAMLEAFERQVKWLEENLYANYYSLSGMNRFATDEFDRILEETGVPMFPRVYFPTRPDLGFEGFNFPPPVVNQAASLEQLASALASTNNAAAIEAADLWATLARDATAISDRLNSVASELIAANKGTPFEKANTAITTMAQSGMNFAQNAALMAQSTTALSAIAPGFAPQVTAAVAKVNALRATQGGIVVAQQAEQLFLQGFRTALATAATAAMPVTRHLMEPAPAGAGGGSTNEATSTISTTNWVQNTQQAARELDLEPHELAERVLDQVATQQSALGLDPTTINPLNAHQHPTTHSGVGSGTTWGAGAGAGYGGGSYAGGTAQSHITGGNTQHNRVSHTMPHQSGSNHVGGTNTTTGTGGGRGTGTGAGGYGAGVGGSHRPGGSHTGRGHNPTGSGVGSGSGSGSGSGGGSHRGHSPYNNGQGTGNNSNTGAGTGGAGGRGSTMAGGAPMGGAGAGAGGGQQANNRKRTTNRTRRTAVKGVLQQAERDKNLLDLLGEAPKVVPRVIGADVFKPRHERDK